MCRGVVFVCVSFVASPCRTSEAEFCTSARLLHVRPPLPTILRGCRSHPSSRQACVCCTEDHHCMSPNNTQKERHRRNMRAAAFKRNFTLPGVCDDDDDDDALTETSSIDIQSVMQPYCGAERNTLNIWATYQDEHHATNCSLPYTGAQVQVQASRGGAAQSAVNDESQTARATSCRTAPASEDASRLLRLAETLANDPNLRFTTFEMRFDPDNPVPSLSFNFIASSETAQCKPPKASAATPEGAASTARALTPAEKPAAGEQLGDNIA